MERAVKDLVVLSFAQKCWCHEYFVLDAVLRALICCYPPIRDGNGFENTKNELIS